MKSVLKLLKNIFSSEDSKFQVGKQNNTGDNNNISNQEVDNSTTMIDNSDHSVHIHDNKNNEAKFVHNPVKGLMLGIVKWSWLINIVVLMTMFIWNKNYFTMSIILIVALLLFLIIGYISYDLSSKMKVSTNNYHPYWKFGIIIIIFFTFWLFIFIILKNNLEHKIDNYLEQMRWWQKFKLWVTVSIKSDPFLIIKNNIFNIYLTVVNSLSLAIIGRHVLEQNHIYLYDKSLNNIGIKFILFCLLIFVFNFSIYFILK
ncbi:hypothetical protein [Streptococcus macacae]|uniref:Uncharacterized protein n=1 Tax=Streptococcus macacae NCTC 11558 TaxID=764298 RepID=G5JWR8_9STRE|nr:hypothetical protein [Streptococcus macacae]EHJ52125.1 hypothetical protein STRMA_1204 [Streptococcus macacae NCTC 11558]SUN79028.1 Uncharacterised protein [Streptococcus macacae NCTC 11558]